MNNIQTILERLEALQPQISTTVDGTNQSVQAAFAYEPADPSSAQAPFFVNEVHGGPTVFQATGGLQRVATHIVMNLCVARIESGGTLYEVQRTAYQWRDAVFAFFAQKLRLGDDLTFILEAHISAWNIIRREFGSAEYLALQFDLQVVELFPLTIMP